MKIRLQKQGTIHTFRTKTYNFYQIRITTDEMLGDIHICSYCKREILAKYTKKQHVFSLGPILNIKYTI